MGANHSSSSSTWPESNGSTTKKPLVIAFHSSMNWRIHFDASKQTKQLDVAQDFGVESMPTFVLVKKGKVVEKVIGADREQLQKKIQKHRY
nr:thioredoxin H2-like [Ipomoea trifida]